MPLNVLYDKVIGGFPLSPLNRKLVWFRVNCLMQVTNNVVNAVSPFNDNVAMAVMMLLDKILKLNLRSSISMFFRIFCSQCVQ